MGENLDYNTLLLIHFRFAEMNAEKEFKGNSHISIIMMYKLLFALLGSYCGSNKPYVQDMTVKIVNDTVLDVSIKIPFDHFSCNNQDYHLADDNELFLEDDCVEKELNKHKVDLNDIYYNEVDNTTTIETSVGDMILNNKC